jgi:hypothetical protein
MGPNIPENEKKPGVCYAPTDDGIELPVIDVSHPAFVFDVSEPALTKSIADTLEDLERFKTMSAAEIGALAQHSILVRGGLQARGGYLSGMTTYLHKLGPDNLGRGYASDRDRRAAGQLLPLAFRHRLATVARLVADSLVEALRVARGPVHLLNIGGGPALDSLNAVILVRKEHADLLTRPVLVRVLDLDAVGPAFGARALAALQSADGPLHGLDVTFEHLAYDWASPAQLAVALDQATRDDAAVVASSEGGLLEYGSDEHIAANLRVFHEHAPNATALVGTLLKDQVTLPARLKWIGAGTGIAVRLLGLDALHALARQTGWELIRIEDGPIHHIIVAEKRSATCREGSAGAR